MGAKLLRSLKIKNPPSIEILHELFVYDPNTGILSRRKPRKNSKNSGCTSTSGYYQTSVKGKLFHVHVIIWAMQTGHWPTIDVDHENGIRTDNRWSNLRLGTRSDNLGNQKVRCTSTSGYRGVYRHGKKWRASIMRNGIRYHLGNHDTPELAFEIYKKRSEELYGVFMCNERASIQNTPLQEQPARVV